MRDLFCLLCVFLGPGVAAAAEPPAGACPGEGAVGVQAALERTAAGAGAPAELDLAACYRALEQEVPEAAALGRALAAGDAATGPWLVVRAILAGRRMARRVDVRLTGSSFLPEVLPPES